MTRPQRCAASTAAGTDANRAGRPGYEAGKELCDDNWNDLHVPDDEPVDQ